MNRDLESALGELAARVEQSHRSGRPPLPLDLITARARRRRRTRAALVATGAAAAVVVVAGAAFAVLPDRVPVPPAHTSTPAPTAARVVLPTGDPTLPFGACGALADAAPAYPVDDRVVAALVLDTRTLVSGGTLAAEGVVDRAPDRDAVGYAAPDGGPRVAVLRDGVVVGATGFSPGIDSVLTGRGADDGDARRYRGPLELTVCDPVDDNPATAGRPLPAGTYELRPWASILTYDGGGDIPVEATAVGEGVTVTVTGEAEVQPPLPGTDVALDRTASAGVPACDGPAPAAPVRSAMLDLQVAPATTTLAVGSPLSAVATVRYTGPGRLQVRGDDAVEYWVVRDGVVVGTTVRPDDAFSPVDLGAGVDLGLTGSERVLTPCRTDGGGTLPAGQYTVYPGWVFDAPVVRTSSEVVELPGPADGYAVTLGAPFTVTLT